MSKELTLEWLEEQLEEAHHLGNTPQNARDYALLSIAVEKMRTRCETKPMTMLTAQQWVQHMPNHMWTEEQVRKFAHERVMDGEDVFPAFFAVMNAMYSDYAKVAQIYNVHTPAFFADLAKAWICDEDAVENKACVYYRTIIKH